MGQKNTRRVFFGAFIAHFQRLNGVTFFRIPETLVFPKRSPSFMAVTSSLPQLIEKEAQSSIYSCACVHTGSCATRKPVIPLCIIYIPDVTISYVTRVAENVVTNQSRSLEPEVY